MIISFAWTKDAFLNNRKSVTRRSWKEDYAKRFQVGSIHNAYDKSPLYGGKIIGKIKVSALYQQNIQYMPKEDYEKEGFKFMEEKGIKIWNKEPRKAFDDWKKEDKIYWVLEFEKL